jgi:mono/diheme cytochrome c family protein
MGGKLRSAGLILLGGFCTSVLASEPKDAAATGNAAGIRFFESKIRPLLVQSCFECHGPEAGKGEADLRVDSLEGLLRGGKSGPALIRGEPNLSLLMLAVRHDGAVAMPPKKKLPQTDIDLLATWIEQGAPWPGAANVGAPIRSQEDSHRWSNEARSFWAFQPVRAADPPSVDDPRWPRTPIDRFILARLEQAGLRPARPADKRTLLRRATIDLLGLPPTSAEVAAFLQDNSAEAFDHVITRLLDSPFYGERWGRHWLDVARYADSNGMDDNLAYSDAWRYRDYVIASFNADKPFHQFAQEQLAGDLLAHSDGASRHDELVVATGFLAIGPKMLAEDDPVKQQLDIVDEQLDTTCRVFMALTMGCVRCHDHKFDPLSMADYYGLAGILNSTRTMISFRVDSKWNTTGLGGSEAEFRVKDLEQIIDRHDNALVNGNTTAMSTDERAAHRRLLDQALKEYSSLPKAMSVAEGHVGDLEIRLRGNHLTRGAIVPRRFPTILAGVVSPAPGARQSGRLEFARWLTNDQHPLTPRVIVNRIWRWHFGQGLVGSVDNFGRLGETPSHPELLDWLARQFIADGWSLKKLHRLILRSQTWQMSATWDERAAQVDPQNRLLWRMPRRRMDAEVLRDALLFVSGQLDATMGGPPMSSVPFQNLSNGGVSRKPELFQSNRRSVYLPVLRGAVYDAFQAFDFPDPAVLNGDRSTTTVASQALFMLNGRLVEQAAKRLSELLLHDASLTDRDRMQRASQQVLARNADEVELTIWERFLTNYQQASAFSAENGETRRALAWEGLCRALLSSNEFIYVE